MKQCPECGNEGYYIVRNAYDLKFAEYHFCSCRNGFEKYKSVNGDVKLLAKNHKSSVKTPYSGV